MEKLQLKSGDKVKMKLIQPQIKCHGRDDVVAYYRGLVVSVYYNGLEDNEYYGIQFKYKGQSVKGRYDVEAGEFVEKEYKDIKIVG